MENKKTADELAISKARQAHIDEWCKGRTAFYNNETLVIGQNFEAGMRCGIAHERQKVQEVMYSIEFAIKYLESTGIQDEKHKHEPEHQMLMDLKQSFEFYNKQRGEK